MTCKECYHNEVCEALYELNGVPRIFARQCAYFRNTADVVEVRYGEWYTTRYATLSGGLNWYSHSCSACDYTYKTVVPIGYDYCPNCGAKMDGEREDKNG